MFKKLHNPKIVLTAAFALSAASFLSAYDGHTTYTALDTNYFDHIDGLKERFAAVCEQSIPRPDEALRESCKTYKAQDLVERRTQTADAQRKSMAVFGLLCVGAGLFVRRKPF